MKVHVMNHRAKILNLASMSSPLRVRLMPGMNKDVDPEALEAVGDHPVTQAMYEAGDFSVPEDDGPPKKKERKKKAAPPPEPKPSGDSDQG